MERTGYTVGHPRKPECFSQKKVPAEAARCHSAAHDAVQTTGFSRQYIFAGCNDEFLTQAAHSSIDSLA